MSRKQRKRHQIQSAARRANLAFEQVEQRRLLAGDFLNNIVPDGRIHGLQDTDADIGVTFDAGSGNWVVASGALDAGDFLVAGVGFDTMEISNLPDVPLTGVNAFSILKIRTIEDAGTNSQGIPLKDFVFDAPTIGEWGGIVDDLFGGASELKKTTEGALLMLFDGADEDFDRIAPPNTLTGSAATLFTGAVEVGELGFTGLVVGGNVQDDDSGEGWEARGPDTPSVASLLPLNLGILGTSFAVALTRLEGFVGLNFAGSTSFYDGGTIFDPKFVDFAGGGSLEGYGDGNDNPIGPWQMSSDADFSFRPIEAPAMLGDTVWEDLNADGIQDNVNQPGGEPGIANVTVKLLTAGPDGMFGTGDDVIEQTLVTADGTAAFDYNNDGNPDDVGFYKFNDLTPGDYKVMFVQPGGFDSVSPFQAGGPAVDSDAGGVMLMSDVVPLASGEFNPTIDAGFYNTAMLGDTVWEDLNADGIQDNLNQPGGEPGIAGVTVKLLTAGPDGMFGTADDVIEQTLVTGDGTNTDYDGDGNDDPLGFYKFNGLIPGVEYQVMFNNPDPALYMFSERQVGGTSTDSDGPMSDTVVLSSGQYDPTIDAGLFRKAMLGDTVWEDLNNNGQQDNLNAPGGEPGIAGVTVKLITAGLDGAFGTADDVIEQTLVTGDGTNTDYDGDGNDDPLGFYKFNGLIPGVEYQVMFNNPDPALYMFSERQVGGTSTDSDGPMSNTVVLSSGQYDPTIDAGLFRKAGLGDFVWHDLDRNGIQDAGEPGIDGATVKLINPSNGSVITTTITGDNPATGVVEMGYYEFTGLVPGDYKVMFVMPAGFTNVSPLDAGGDDTIDSDAGIGLMTPEVTLASGDFNPTLDAGFFKPAGRPGIEIEKHTNGVDADTEAGAPLIAPGGLVTWTYIVENTGDVDFAFADIVIVDDAGTPLDMSDDFSTTSGDITLLVGDGVILSPGEIWTYRAAAIADDLSVAGPSITIDFEGLSAGTIIDTQFAGVTISADGASTAGNAAMIFNSSSPTGGDLDLGTPNQTFGGGAPGVGSGGEMGQLGANGVALGNILIVSEDLDSTNPDDDASGGMITFIFDDPVNIETLSVLDIDTSEAGGSIATFFQAGGSTSIPLDNLGNNSFQKVSINLDNVTSIEVDFVSSGAITELVYNEPGHGCYENFAEVTTGGGPTDIDPSHYCNPDDDPGIDVEKFTNGVNADDEADAPLISPGDLVTWTYKVTNTGNVPFDIGEISIVDDHGTPGNSSDDLTTDGDIVFDPLLSAGLHDGDDVLEPGEMWIYTASDDADDLSTAGAAGTFVLTGGTSTDGPDGNVRTYSASGVDAKVSAFSRDRSTNGWEKAYLGAYSSGLGVTDTAEGGGGNGTHRVDNLEGRDNYVFFAFSQEVIIDQAYLSSVVGDSDISVWVGTITDAFDPPAVMLSDSILNGLTMEVDNTGSSSSRWANFNGSEVAGNVLVIAASTVDTSPEDRFKLKKVKFQPVAAGCYENLAEVSAGGVGDMDPSHYCNPDGDPDIDIEKLTNGVDADNPDGADVPEIAPGETVTWTYKVTNTGDLPFGTGDIAIVDDNGTASTGDDFSIVNGRIMLVPGHPLAMHDLDDLLEPGEMWVYEASDEAQTLSSGGGTTTTIHMTGNSSTDGDEGNIRTYSAGGVSVKASAFSRANSDGDWDAVFLGAYSSGLGVTDRTEGSGGNGTHRVDNVGDEKNYVLFEFSDTVIVDRTFLDSVVNDSDITVWIGTKTDPFNNSNHNSLSDSFLAGLELVETNNTGSGSARWADINAGEVSGNVLVIAASVSDSTPEDRFKIRKLEVTTLEAGIYGNKATVTADGVSDMDPSHYRNPVDDPQPPSDPTKFYVVDKGNDRTYEYKANGEFVEKYSIAPSHPTGATADDTGENVWVVDSYGKVYHYDEDGNLLADWSSGIGNIEGIATDGTDIWTVRERRDQVYFFDGGATATTDQGYDSKFSLHSNNTIPKGITTNGEYIWVVNEGNQAGGVGDKVYVYTVGGTYKGRWQLDNANRSPRGITIDPNGGNKIWIVDAGKDKIFEYSNATGKRSGGLTASASYDLKDGNDNPQGIADPPAPGADHTGSTDSQLHTLAEDVATAFASRWGHTRELRQQSALGQSSAASPRAISEFHADQTGNESRIRRVRDRVLSELRSARDKAAMVDRADADDFFASLDADAE